MKITLCIDKQERKSPSSELRQYSIDIGCPLRSIDDTYDELKIITDDENKLVGSIIRRCYIDKYGVLKKLLSEETQELVLPEIKLFEGINYIYIKEFINLNMKIEYLTNAEMNKYFASKVEMKTTIKQTYDEIMLSVSKKVGEDEIISKINMSPEEITILANKLGITANDILNIIAGNTINLTAKNIEIDSTNFKVDENGNMTCNDATMNNINISGGSITLDDNSSLSAIKIINSQNDHIFTQYNSEGIILKKNGKQTVLIANSPSDDSGYVSIGNNNSTETTIIAKDGITTPALTQTSLESIKKNFERFENGLSIIKNADIYKYHLKVQDDKDKKHIGLVIGSKYNTPDIIIQGNGVDLYAMCSIAWQSIKELNSKIEQLIKRIEDSENEK